MDRSDGQLKQFEKLMFERKVLQYPNAPRHAIAKVSYSDCTANGLAKCIIDYLAFNGHHAWRQSSEGRYRPGKQYVDVIGRTRLMKGTYLPGQNNGAGDVCAIVRGLFVAWEIKIGRDKQSDVQKRYQQEVEQSGGRYFICHSFDEFILQFKQL